MIVLDSDALIKLAKCGVLETVARAWRCCVPQAVFRETVERGKQESYPDAMEIEQVVAKHMEIHRLARHPQAERLLSRRSSLGAGEQEALRLYFSLKADGIVTDDAAFVQLLREAQLPTWPPAVVLIALAREGHLSIPVAREALEKLKGFIRAEVYREVLADLQLLAGPKGGIR
jgi:predicted nucleic acid-binding protein